MVLRRCLIIIMMFLAITGAGLWLPSKAEAKQINNKKAIILFPGSGKNDISMVGGFQIANLLGHFNIRYDLVPCAQYKKDILKNYKYGFFIGRNEDYKLPDQLMKDILSYNRAFFWIGSHFNHLKSVTLRKLPAIEYQGKADGVKYIIYKNYKLTKGDPAKDSSNDRKIDRISIGSDVKVHAWAELESERLPYIVQDNNFWYIADIPFSFAGGANRYLAFCDILHEFLGILHNENHQAIVRIEDVDPTSSPEKIRQIADLLNSKSVPFLISVTPVFVDPANNVVTPLICRPETVSAIKYAVSKGATIVMHGYTHQYKGKSGYDFEFWDEKSGSPVNDDSESYVDMRIDNGLLAFMKCGLFPVIWETPHYTASSVDYRAISRHFSTAIESKIFFNNRGWNQMFPYIIEKDIYGQRIIPEDLGYVPFIEKDGKPDMSSMQLEVEKITETARHMLCVRDSMGGFFFHSFMEIPILVNIIDNMRNLGYSFIDVKNMSNTVSIDDKAIVTGCGEVLLRLNNKFLKELSLDAQGRIKWERVSKERLTRNIKKSITNPPGCIYAAMGYDGERSVYMEPVINNTSSARTFQKRNEPEVKNSTPEQKKTNKNKRKPEKRIASCAILWNETVKEISLNKDQEAFEKTIESLCVSINKISSVDAVSNENLLIIPYCSAIKLKKSNIKTIKTYIESGGVLLIDGITPLSSSLGYSKAGKINVTGIRDVYNRMDFFTEGKMDSVSNAQAFDVAYKTGDGRFLGLLKKNRANGGVFFISDLYDPASGYGYSRFPTLVNILFDYFNFVPPVATPGIEAYFEPGTRWNENIENLARIWRNMGIRVIHAGMWHLSPNYAYDYKRLIDACHRQGIAVNAWLELPHLTQFFWEKHPKFREKNYLGKDVRTFWRYPLAIYDPECRKAVFKELDKIFSDYDFDGVNLAEIYFEGENIRKPEDFAPFHPTALKDFKEKYKFDMKEVFSPSSKHYWKKNKESSGKFHKFRIDLITTLHRDYISFLDDIRKKKQNFEVIVTVVDSIKNPDVKETCAVDSEKIAGLMKDYPFTLFVEDPWNMWNKSPLRYVEIRKAYEAIGVPISRLGLNINVWDIHEKGGQFACAKQTGAELFRLLHDSSAGGNRVVVYAEGTIKKPDIKYLPYAIVRNRETVFPEEKITGKESLHITWTNYDLRKLEEKEKEAVIEYEAMAPVYIGTNRKPKEVMIDDIRLCKDILQGNDEWIIRLPSGGHRIKITSE